MDSYDIQKIQDNLKTLKERLNNLKNNNKSNGLGYSIAVLDDAIKVIEKDVNGLLLERSKHV
jgi:hypothetical protein